MQVTRALAIVCVLLACHAASYGVGLPPGTSIEIVATADYTNIFEEVQSADPATVTLTVVQVAGATVDWDPPSEVVAQGEDLYVPVRITNTGNGVDTYTLTTTSTRGWTVSLIYDENDDGVHQISETWEIHDTMLVADGHCPCFAKVSVPADAATGDVITVNAVSAFSPINGSGTANIDVASPGMFLTHMTLSASPESPCVGQAVTVTGQLQPGNQQQISITVTDPSSASTPTSCTTLADGSFSFGFTPTVTGLYTVQASFAGNELYSNCASSVVIDVVPKIATSITLAVSPANPSVGATVAVSGTILPAMATSIAMACAKPSGAVAQAAVNSDQFGRFTWSTQADVAGQWSVVASYAGGERHLPSTRQATFQAAAEQGAHSITIRSGPSVNPTSVTAPETAVCSVTADDSLGHNMTYEWSDGAAGGTFTPNSRVASPAYRPAANLTQQDRTVTLTCTIKCASDPLIAAVGSVVLTVRPSSRLLPQLTACAPHPNASLVALDSEMLLKFSKAMNAASTQQAFTISPAITGAAYAWTEDGKLLTINHQPFAAGTTYTCAITTAATDSTGLPLERPYQWQFTTVPGLRFDPSDIGAEPGAEFATPSIIANNPSEAANVTFTLTVPEGIAVDTALDGSGNLACVHKGDDTGAFVSAWDSATREIAVTAALSGGSLERQVVKSIRLTAPANAGDYSLDIDGSAALDVRVRAAYPGDFNRDGFINISDAARFVQAWVRWHGDVVPAYDADIDAIFDLAPHTEGVWPNWTPIGDHQIDTQDAAAFIECWVGAHDQQQGLSAGAYNPIRPSIFEAFVNTSTSELTITVNESTDGTFETAVQLPEGALFDPSVAPSGNLMNVKPGSGVGNVFFSEYDPITRSVRVTGTVSGASPYQVAVVGFSR